jgi:Galactose binding lectin domain
LIASCLLNHSTILKQLRKSNDTERRHLVLAKYKRIHNYTRVYLRVNCVTGGNPLPTNTRRTLLTVEFVIFSVRLDEYCQWETFNATCAHSHVILITSAVYGRMRIGRCVPYDYFVGCSTEVYDQLAARCSGRQHCSVPIPDTELFKVHPCRKDLVAYMEASYQCVPGLYRVTPTATQLLCLLTLT